MDRPVKARDLQPGQTFRILPYPSGPWYKVMQIKEDLDAQWRVICERAEGLQLQTMLLRGDFVVHIRSAQ